MTDEQINDILIAAKLPYGKGPVASFRAGAAWQREQDARIIADSYIATKSERDDLAAAIRRAGEP